MYRIYFIISILLCMALSCSAQKEEPIIFNCHHIKNNTDNIQLNVANVSANKIYYYSIGVDVKTDTGWAGLLADINSLGQNEFWVLKPIKPEEKVSKTILRTKIDNSYPSCRGRQIRFSIFYYTKKDFNSSKKIIHSVTF